MNSSFYYKHFGISHAPFAISPQPDFFFGGASRDNYLKELIHFAKYGEGIALLVGEVGSGKTMLISMLLRNISKDKDFVTILINSSMKSEKELIRSIALQLELKEDKNVRFQIEKKLIDNFASGMRTIVIVDEAQSISQECLEYIRLLSNLETSRGKMLQVIIAAQPEILSTLASFEMRAFSDRVTLHIGMRELTIIEIRYYIDHRIRLAGYRGDRLFDDSSIKLITEISGGLNRRIHLLADKALMAAYADSSQTVRVEHVNISAKELFTNKQLVKKKKTNLFSNKYFNPQYAFSSILLVVIIIAIVNSNLFSKSDVESQLSASTKSNVNENQQPKPIETKAEELSIKNETSKPVEPTVNQVTPESTEENNISTTSVFPQVLVKVSEKAVKKEEEEQFNQELIKKLERYNRKVNWHFESSKKEYPKTTDTYRKSKLVLAKANENEWYVRILSIKYHSPESTEALVSSMQNVNLPEQNKLVVYRYQNMLRAIVTGFQSQQQANNNIRDLMQRYEGVIETKYFYSLPITHLF